MPTVTAAATDLVVDIAGLTHVYRTPSGDVPVLDRLDATFAPGTWTAIMGPSGSGKSTFLYCAAGLVRPTSGRVTLAGVDVTTSSAARLTRMRQRDVGFVFQAFNLVPALTALQNLQLPSLFSGRALPRETAVATLDRVGLASRAGHRPEQLSGGEQQRVAIARALAMQPRVVFADEPTGALDGKASDRVLGEFRALVDDGAALVMVTHDPGVAARADRVLFLGAGRVAFEARQRAAAEIAAILASIEEEATR